MGFCEIRCLLTQNLGVSIKILFQSKNNQYLGLPEKPYKLLTDEILNA